jgi:hypothetical protein
VAASPYTLTITPTLTEAITTSTNSYLIKHEYIYVHVDDNGDIDVTGDVLFGDNDKAIFGAGSDLQIYHDINDSYISDQGSGNLKLLTDEFRLRNAADSAHMITGSQGGAITAYHNGSAKLATTSTGIDVTGKLETSGNNNGGAKANYIRITDTDTSATLNNQQGGIEFYTSDSGNEGVTASIENLYAGSGAGQ